ncbi:putative protein phosphatase 2C 46 [Brachypodium distachyon]|uniref:protein-serine/threonine phosphatase n=1 Tax=Brachypodium distachyon TaxID=15368 RepID=A0A0Q3J5P9_BRADI|nr:putative protein phosphatase 2C 46 [Brachypodium distachyon]KQK07980.1 hypothetical protein BRADI_2g38770v3 [Brachypodium distachyon]|eukprot:XP_014754417.2 putative protein phosphatase 2C 46 [Brachypodium distachyon]
MGNRATRLATPCFAAGGGSADDVDGGAINGGGIGHILSFDGGEDGPAALLGGATIHGVLLPSNQSTLGASSSSSVLNADHLSGGSSSSNSFSFRTLDYCPSPSSSSGTTMASSGVLSRQAARTDEQILADLYATRRRRRCQQLEESAPKNLLHRLRRALASLPLLPRVPSKKKTQQHAIADTTNGSGAIESNGCDEEDDRRAQWARGEAGEDRVHVVVSSSSETEKKEMFVGIYDGFNGPDAADYLAANLYAAIDEHTTSLMSEREVLDGMARALRRTEEAYFAAAEARAAECPELGMAGSCVLVVLVRGADVYAMNVGDSRALLARRDLPGAGAKEIRRRFDGAADGGGDLVAVQLTMDHSTSAYKEVRRIRSEHLDDPACIVNGRVKGSLQVTRAFGAGYLKEPRWNDALLEVFRVDYVGSSPYITCRPFLRHHRLRPRDKFLILASDGLFEYFTNEEAVAQVEAFTARYPDEDPAKYLSHEILLRAANQAGMEFNELLEVQHGDDRRRYHDDVSVIIISLDGKIWRS